MSDLQLVQTMTAVERLASLLAAISHDLDHPGTNQSFLIATSNPLVPLYQVWVYLQMHFIADRTATPYDRLLAIGVIIIIVRLVAG